MQILMLWLLNPLQIYKHSPTKLVWLVRKLLLPESFTIQHIATTKDRVPFIVLSPYAVLPVRAYKRGSRLQRTGRCRSVQRFFSENKNIGLLWAKVRRFCIKSTEVCIKEVRCFALPIHHYEIPPSTTLEAVSALLKKKYFAKMSYISYTLSLNFLYVQAFSGVGWGVGCCFSV